MSGEQLLDSRYESRSELYHEGNAVEGIVYGLMLTAGLAALIATVWLLVVTILATMHGSAGPPRTPGPDHNRGSTPAVISD